MIVKDKNVLVFGSGISGEAACALLLKEEAKVVLYDGNDKLNPEEIRAKIEGGDSESLEIILGTLEGDRKEELLDKLSLVVMSPGVPTDLPIVNEMREKGLPIWGEIELAYHFAKGRIVAITGTNGKTTTATLLYDLVRAMGYKAGLISTVVYKIDGREVEATHTTPDSIRLNAMMREMADAGCAYCFMECSSHAIVQERTRGLDFAGGIFSNITHDHLDYHKTFAEYIRAKKLFFDGLPKGAFALTNADDRNGRVMVQNTAAAVSAYSLRAMADFRCKIVEMHLDGMLLRIDGQELWVGLLGRFNAYNLLAVYGAAALLGLNRGEVLRVLSMLHAVSGRFEKIRAANGTTAIVDYAHTPDALENVLRTLGELLTSS
mgnify:CR=1 FL=1